MSRRLKPFAWITSGVLLGVILAAGYAWHAVGQVDLFYQQALLVEAPELATASEELKERVAQLVADSEQPAGWDAEITDAQVNGWLAVALATQLGKQLPKGIADPRVAFDKGQITLGFRYADQRLNSVVTLAVTPFVMDGDMLGIRLVSARAGTLPIPLKQVAKKLAEGAAQLKLPLAWTEDEAGPVALFPLAAAVSTADERKQLESVELVSGALRVAGQTRLIDPAERLAKRENPLMQR